MRIGIVRGPFLNKFEIQSYEPLAENHDITAYYTNCGFNTVKDIDLPLKKMISLESIFGTKLGTSIYTPFRTIGYGYHMFGLEKELESMDIAHTAETYWAFSDQCIDAKKLYGIKVVVTQWENIPYVENMHNIRKLFLEKKVKERIRKNADLFIATTYRAREALIIEGVPEEKIETIFPGIDLEKFNVVPKDQKLKEKYGFEQEDIVVLFVGRLVWQKGVYDLIYASKKIIEKFDNVKFLIVGTGREEEKIRSLIRVLKINDSVKMAGNIPYNDISKIYSISDIFVLPSIPTKNWQEQFGFVLVEAMASGKAVIATLSGSIPEVVGEAGILVQPNDPVSLCQSLEELVNNKTRRKELERLARKRAEIRFDHKKVAKSLESAYEKII